MLPVATNVPVVCANATGGTIMSHNASGKTTNHRNAYLTGFIAPP
jgi:hypothetical protein